MSPKRFEFIVADKSGRANSADRALIRSHCMRGKNKRDGSRRSLRQQRTAAAGEQTDGQPIVTMPPRAPSETELVPFEADISEESRRIFFKSAWLAATLSRQCQCANLASLLLLAKHLRFLSPGILHRFWPC